ncbi:tumor necrosis factor receptor superfamily member 16-like [Diadema antillarum]|uniref:tumor necrosis factor receptor superfamily member 16-like n=1 Tax=Diadema antillarum TaxID=105358 RepID=UPI003A84EA12
MALSYFPVYSDLFANFLCGKNVTDSSPSPTPTPLSTQSSSSPPVNATNLTPTHCVSGRFTSTGACCEECPPGFRVHQQCTEKNSTNTICTMCEPELTFSDVASHMETCKPCTRCTHNQKQVSACNIMQDAVCECDQDYFKSSGGVFPCSQCNICPPGFGAAVPCSPTQNSVCEKCENGTFSDEISTRGRCKQCTVCGEKSSVLKPCTRFSDTVCSDVGVPPSTYKPLGGDVTMTSRNPMPGMEASGFSVVPIFCSLLGLVIFGLLAYVIFKKWSFKKMKLRHTQKMTRSNSCHTDMEANTISVLSLKNGQSFHSRDSALDRSGIGSISRQPLMAVPSTTPYQHLPADKRAELERALFTSRMDGRDWRGLARELGFTDVDIVSIAQTSTAATPPPRVMLVAWQARDSKRATVGALVESLIRIRRNDVANLIPVFTYNAYHLQNS